MQLLHLTTSLLLLRLVHSIEVTPNSKCFYVCANDISDGSNIADGKYSWTIGSNVVCEDYQLAGPNSTIQGRKWKECLTCELNSTAVDSPSKENELYWVLFNMKFSFDWCVFAYPDNSNLTAAGTACAETCQGPDDNAKTALVDRLLQTNATLQYQYCETENGAFSKVADDCAKCLEEVPNSQIMVNYVNALNAACTQKPALGRTLELDFDLFPPVSTPSPTQSEAVVTITANPIYPPPSAVSAISASTASQASALATAAAEAKAKSDKSRSLGLGVGITAAGVLAILAILGLIFGRRRAKQNRMIADGQARARWEVDYHARQQEQQQQQHYWSDHGKTPEELDLMYNSNTFLPEVSDGSPKPAELPSRSPKPAELPSRSTSRTLRNPEIGIAYKQPLTVVSPVEGQGNDRKAKEKT